MSGWNSKIVCFPRPGDIYCKPRSTPVGPKGWRWPDTKPLPF